MQLQLFKLETQIENKMRQNVPQCVVESNPYPSGASRNPEKSSKAKFCLHFSVISIEKHRKHDDKLFGSLIMQ